MKSISPKAAKTFVISVAVGIVVFSLVKNAMALVITLALINLLDKQIEDPNHEKSI